MLQLAPLRLLRPIRIRKLRHHLLPRLLELGIVPLPLVDAATPGAFFGGQIQQLVGIEVSPVGELHKHALLLAHDLEDVRTRAPRTAEAAASLCFGDEYIGLLLVRELRDFVEDGFCLAAGVVTVDAVSEHGDARGHLDVLD